MGSSAWSGAVMRGEGVRAAGWMFAAFLLRALLAARIEGALDHDQGVVGLMALDIAAGRRWPIFFDGQRYMGAIEAYTAALLVRVLGFAPAVVSLAPTFYFSLLVAGQYLAWSAWSGRGRGHLAALLTVACSPMLALWSVAARGGYSELLAWSMPVLAVYRRLTRPAYAPPGRLGQASWGLLLFLGYFVNPLSLVVYATLAIDWTLGRHGADLRALRKLSGRWLETRLAPFAVVACGAFVVILLALCCHVESRLPSSTEGRFVFLFGVLPGGLGRVLGILGAAAILAAVAIWTGAGPRAWKRLAQSPAFALGALLALAPFAVYQARVSLENMAPEPSVPIWIRVPWDLDSPIRFGRSAIGPLVGCDVRPALRSIIGPFLTLKPPAWSIVERALGAVSPVISLLVGALVVVAAWRDRIAWRRFWSLQGDEPTPPTQLCLLGLATGLGLYLLQATCASELSTRYLIPLWIFLPGLLGSGLMAMPRLARWAAVAVLVGCWSTAQAALWADFGQPCPLRPVADELERAGVTAIVAPRHVVVLVAELTAGRVGGLEYKPSWPRLRARYRSRFREGQPLVCVNDREPGRADEADLGARLHELARHHPERTCCVWCAGRYEIWKVDLPLRDLLH